MTDFNTSDRDVTRAIRSWLHEDRHEDVSHIAGAVLDQVDTTRQRRPWWAARRFGDMNTLAKFFVAAAAMVAVAVVGINVLPGTGTGTGTGSQPSPSPSPTLAPTASPQPTPARVPSSGPIEAGTYVVSDGQSSIRVTFPAGWDVAENGRDIRKHRDQPNEVMFTVYSPDINVYPDACATEDRPPPTGPTRDDLIAALRAQANSDVSNGSLTTVGGGLPGLRLLITVPKGLDVAGCSPGALRIWSGATGGNYLAFGPAPTYEPATIDILETSSGGRIVLSAGSPGTPTATDQAELQAIVDSIQIEPAP